MDGLGVAGGLRGTGEGRWGAVPGITGMGDAGLRALGGTGDGRAHRPLSKPPVKVSAPLRALGGQREALPCRAKAILNNSSASQEGEKPTGYGIALALNYTVGGSK